MRLCNRFVCVSTYASGVTAGGCSISGSVPTTSSGLLATRAGRVGSGPPITSWAGGRGAGVAGASAASRTGTDTFDAVAAASARSSAARAAWAARRERGDASGAAAGAGDDELPESLESVLADESVAA